MICVPEHDLSVIMDIIAGHAPDCDVLAFGSRHHWISKEYSDLDLAFDGGEPLGMERCSRLEAAFAESSLSYRVDVLDYRAISPEFRAIIDRGNQMIYRGKKSTLDRSFHAMVRERRDMPFSEAVLINPPVRLDKGAVYPFIDMSSVVSHQRDTPAWKQRIFTGNGSRFQPFDTLMARITPCLENGKITRYQTESKEPAFGSTEFIVIRGRPGVTDNDFAYYLTRRPDFRQFAISKMTGASGRQRVPPEALSLFQVNVPGLSEQRGIASILGALDDKIELNRRRNRTLEKMAQAIFKSWFIGLSAGRRIVKLGDVCTFDYGRPLKEEDRRGGCVAVMGSNGQVGWHDSAMLNGPGIVVGRKGNPGTVIWVNRDFHPIDTTFYVMRTNDKVSLEYLYFLLKEIDLPKLRADSEVPGLNRNAAYLCDVTLPPQSLIESFSKICRETNSRIARNEDESRMLADMRDTLLPKLMSGELSVANIRGAV